ncbi:MAG: capsule assembly Wzi family protein [Bacteroidales bacterium]|nr:capsule assembly Wzi family protein [Bacteroidales bacterium]
MHCFTINFFALKAGGKLPVHIEIGLYHISQWGGVVEDTIRLPHDFNSFMDVFSARSGSENAPRGEWVNRLGNHIGVRNYSIDFQSKIFRIKLYEQDMFEDRSGWNYKNRGGWIVGFITDVFGNFIFN